MKQTLIFLFVFTICFNLNAQNTAKSGFKQINISKIPKPTAPANLSISDVVFNDSKGNSNSILDAGEKAEISFKVSNTGKGNAYQLQVEIKDINAVNGISVLSMPSVVDLAAGSSTTFSIPLRAASSLVDATAKFQLLVKEGNGFDSDPLFLEVSIQKFKNPQLALADHILSNTESEGKIKLGQMHIPHIKPI